MTATVTIRELNQQTSTIIQRAHDGEDLIVTKAGAPMVRLTGYVPQTSLEQLVAEGRVIPAQDGVLRDFAVFRGGRDIDRLLGEERADRDVQ